MSLILLIAQELYLYIVHVPYNILYYVISILLLFTQLVPKVLKNRDWYCFLPLAEPITGLCP